MKTFVFEANCKNEKSAIENAKDFLRMLRRNPEDFSFEVKKVKFRTYRIKCKEIIA